MGKNLLENILRTEFGHRVDAEFDPEAKERDQRLKRELRLTEIEGLLKKTFDQEERGKLLLEKNELLEEAKKEGRK